MSITDPQKFPHQERYSPFTPNFAETSAEPNPRSNALTPETIHPSTSAAPKPRPRKKPDPTAAMTIPPCTECGKRFSSWKALFGHMRCHPERQWRGINPPPHFRRPLLLLSPSQNAQFTSKEYEVASSLIMLANGPPRVEDPSHRAAADVAGIDVARPVSCGFGLDETRRHRAGHKRAWEEIGATVGCEHMCSVCSRGFSSGQALGGHMRCHWEKGEENVGHSSSGAGPSKNYVLDLNLPPPVESNEGSADTVLDLKLGM